MYEPFEKSVKRKAGTLNEYHIGNKEVREFRKSYERCKERGYYPLQSGELIPYALGNRDKKRFRDALYS